jgi:hypothetical protein
MTPNAPAITPSDFVMVELTPRGQEIAGQHSLTISNGRRSFTFTPGVPLRVERSYEWNVFLRTHVDGGGSALFQLAPPSTSTPAATQTAGPATTGGPAPAAGAAK